VLVPVVEAPEGSGCGGWEGCGCNCLGLTPEVEGVVEECGVLGAGETLESVPGGDAGAGGGAGGTPGGAVFVGVAAVFVVDGPKG